MDRRMVPLVFVVVAAVAVAGVGSAARTINACSLITAAQARSILGYQLRVQQGETLAQCVIVAVPLKLDSTLKPFHPTVMWGTSIDGGRAVPFVQEMAQERKAVLKNGGTFTPVSGVGSSAYLASGPDRSGGYAVYAKVGTTVINFKVGPATNPLSRVRGVRLVRAIAARV